MDGGVKQAEMAERLKRDIKETRRRGDRVARPSGDRISVSGATTNRLGVLPPKPLGDLASPITDFLKATQDIHNDGMEPNPTTPLQKESPCNLIKQSSRESIAFGRSDTVLFMFYLEHLFPFLFPFYHPSILQGGRSWVLEMMISSPVVKKATLCQSVYFFSLAQGSNTEDTIWDMVLTQTRDAFEMLRQSLQFIDGSNIAEHFHGAVRIMTSIMQVQRFEVAVLSFNNCQAHLKAALALFNQLLDNSGADEPAGPSSKFNAIMSRLESSSWVFPTQCDQIPSPEQAGFCFSSSLLVLDDIIASTLLQEEPKLHEYHSSLLGNDNGSKPPINLEVVIGCQNWVLLRIGEIAVLDAWKQRCKRAGNLDVMELVQRATTIKNFLKCHLSQLEAKPAIIPNTGRSLLDILTADYSQQNLSASQSAIVTRVWAHAALVYLFIVVSGWQPASVDVQYHVGCIIELLTYQISPPSSLRTMVWPFCVAGCLAEPSQENHLRNMVEALQPPSIFGTLRKALEIMENVWRNRNAGDESRDLATCFRSQGDLVLLV